MQRIQLCCILLHTCRRALDDLRSLYQIAVAEHASRMLGGRFRTIGRDGSARTSQGGVPLPGAMLQQQGLASSGGSAQALMAKATFRIICSGCTSAPATKYLLLQDTRYACADYRTPEKQVLMTLR